MLSNVSIIIKIFGWAVFENKLKSLKVAQVKDEMDDVVYDVVLCCDVMLLCYVMLCCDVVCDDV